MRDTTVDRPVDQCHFECNKCPLESHLERMVLHFSLTQTIEITQCVSPSFKRKSTPVELAIDAIRVEGRSYFTAYLRDITQRRQIEAALRAGEQRLTATYEHAFVGISEVDARGRFLRVNEQLSRITDYSREELLTQVFP